MLPNHDEIRRWAEERGAKPARVCGTGGDGDVGMIRLDFPSYSGEESLEEISWVDWFRKFDGSNLALLVQDRTARGEKSNFNKLVSRDTVLQGSRKTGERSNRGRRHSATTRRRRASGTSRRTASARAGSKGRQSRLRGQSNRGQNSRRSSGSNRSSASGSRQSRGGSRTKSSPSRANSQTSSGRRSQSGTAGSRSRNVRSIGKRSMSTTRTNARRRAA